MRHKFAKFTSSLPGLDLAAVYRNLVQSLGGTVPEVQIAPTLEKTRHRKAKDEGTSHPISKKHYRMDDHGTIHRKTPKHPADVSHRVYKRQRVAERNKRLAIEAAQRKAAATK